MKRYRQTFEEIVTSLIPVEASWLDDHAEEVIKMIQALPTKQSYDAGDVMAMLNTDYETAFTVIRLFLDQSKDEFILSLKESFKNDEINKGTGVTRYRLDKASYTEALIKLGLTEKMAGVVNRPLLWSDVLVERLKGGRGSAIKGQTRGRGMEDFVEKIVRSVRKFPHIDVRECQDCADYEDSRIRCVKVKLAAFARNINPISKVSILLDLPGAPFYR